MFKNLMLALVIAAVGAFALPTESEAKRLGGGRSSGLQRATPDAPAKAAPGAPAQPAATPGTPGTPAATPAAAAGATGAAAAAGKRSWLGPVAGLAAGLGLVALMSSLGLGAEFADFIMLALLAVVAVVVIRMLMRRFAGGGNNAAAPQGMRYTAAGGAPEPSFQRGSSPMPAPVVIGSALQPAQVTGSTGAVLPADFDAAGFERIAKTIFVRMQAANDSANLDDLRGFTTPELFAELRVDLLDRGPAAQHTDVLDLQTQVLDVADEGDRQIVSVGFTGRVREADGAEPEAFDELWHLVRPADGSRNWAIAGIQQRR